MGKRMPMWEDKAEAWHEILPGVRPSCLGAPSRRHAGSLPHRAGKSFPPAHSPARSVGDRTSKEAENSRSARKFGGFVQGRRTPFRATCPTNSSPIHELPPLSSTSSPLSGKISSPKRCTPIERNRRLSDRAQVPAVHGQQRAAHVAGHFASQEDDRAGQLFW